MRIRTPSNYIYPLLIIISHVVVARSHTPIYNYIFIIVNTIKIQNKCGDK